MLYGVDVHGGYQAGLDWPTLARQGYTFGVVKATQGTTYTAPQFAPWIRAGRAVGLVMGAYHWIERGNAAAQVDHFLDVLATVGGPAGLLVQLDCEDSADWATLQAWDAEWTRRTGGHPYLIYSGSWWWNAAGRRWPGNTLTPYLWQSHYLWDTVANESRRGTAQALGPQVPDSWWTPGYGGWPRATILQFTSRGDAGGLSANVDLNAYTGTREQLLALTRPPGEDMAFADDYDAWHVMWRTKGLAAGDDPILIPAHPQTKHAAKTEPNRLAQQQKKILDGQAAIVAGLTALAAHTGMSPEQLQAIAGAARAGAEDGARDVAEDAVADVLEDAAAAARAAAGPQV